MVDQHLPLQWVLQSIGLNIFSFAHHFHQSEPVFANNKMSDGINVILFMRNKCSIILRPVKNLRWPMQYQYSQMQVPPILNIHRRPIIPNHLLWKIVIKYMSLLYHTMHSIFIYHLRSKINLPYSGGM